jgi:hypothetical protein
VICEKEYTVQIAICGLIKISHLGNNGSLLKFSSTERIADLVSEIPFA